MIIFWSDNLQILCRRLALVGHLFVLNSLTLIESVESGFFNGRDVNKNVSATAASRLNKTVSFGWVEPLHCALSHIQTPMLMRQAREITEAIT